MSEFLLIDPELWAKTRAGARSGRGFRYQDAVAAGLAIDAWNGSAAWTVVVPEGVDDVTLHGPKVEYRVQLKSRHDPKGHFTVAEVAQHLAKTALALPEGWDQDDRLHIALVLEREVDGLTATDWTLSLDESGQPLGTLLAELKAQLGKWSPEMIRSLLSRAHLVIEPQPMDRAVERLASASMPDAAARLLAQRLRETAGAMADENYRAQYSSPNALGVSEVQLAIDALRAAIDPKALLELTAGLCEAANFAEPIDATGFYSGVDVVPAHLGAGLVFDRPHDVAQVLEGLEQRRATLVAGPSGAGKSALTWLSAFHTRHAVRWYRVRACRPDDVAALIQWARLLEARPERPVGFVIDDVGRDEHTAGWDLLVREKNAVPGLLLIGTAREEDLFTLRTLPQTTLVRPALDEALAIQIWQALSTEDVSVFSHWQEPLDLSRGLLLEYAHLLTAGRRLEETLTEQVERRLAEARDDELLALRVIAFATAQGSAVDPERLRSRLGWETPRFARTLKRLIDEHAVRQAEDAGLSALHEIRSTYLDTAIQSVLGDRRETALVEAIHTVRADAFVGLVVQTLRKWPEQTDILLEAAAARLSDPETPASAWIALLHGLAVATADRVATRWLEISRKRDIDDRFSAMAFTFVVAKSKFDDGSLFSPITKAQADFAAIEEPDLRTALLKRLSPEARPPIIDLETAHQLVAAMLPLTGCKAGPTLNLGIDGSAGQAPLIPLLEFIQILAEVDADQARKAVETYGGAEALLERLYQETAWITRPTQDEHEGKACVKAQVRHVSAPSQANLNDFVVRVCELMSIAAPDAEVMVCDAVFANGKPFGVGRYAPGSKRLRREILPSPARIALNRVQNRAIGRLVAADNETDRATALARAVTDLAKLLSEAANFYCRQEQAGPYWSGLKVVRGLMTQLIPPPHQTEIFAGPLDQGAYQAHDAVHGFATSIQTLIEKLTQTAPPKLGLMAINARELASKAAELTDPALWRMTGEKPAPALETLRTTLQDVAAVLADADVDPDRAKTAALRFSKTSRRNNILPRAAQEARQRCLADVEAKCREITNILGAHGLTVQVFARPTKEAFGLSLLNASYLAIQKVDSIGEWLVSEPKLLAACQDLPDVITLASAPLRDGVIAPIGVQFTLELLPYGGLVRDWQGRLPFPVLEDPLLDDFRQASEALATVSTILQERDRPLLEEESDHLCDQLELTSQFIEHAARLFEADGDEDVAEVASVITSAFHRVQAEFAQAPDGLTLAVETLEPTSELALHILAAQVVLIERGIARKQAGLIDAPSATTPVLEA